MHSNQEMLELCSQTICTAKPEPHNIIGLACCDNGAADMRTTSKRSVHFLPFGRCLCKCVIHALRSRSCGGWERSILATRSRFTTPNIDQRPFAVMLHVCIDSQILETHLGQQ